ncbi:MAG: hypothetical protein MUE40_18050, partial [Anaerolineae bacterium]|nr:hypothetical protein [Anaerolineae bacterium]
AHLTGMALGVLVALIVYAPWLVNIPSQLQKVNAYYWVTEPGLDKLVTTFYLFLTVYAEIAPPWSLLALMGALFLLLFGLIQAGVALRRPGRHSGAQRRGVGLALWLALLPPLLMWLVSQVQPVFLERSLITSAILLYVFLAWVLAASRLPRPLVGLLALIILMQVGIGLGAQYRLNSFPYSPVQPLLACVYSQWQPGDVIVHMNKLSALPGVYYGRQYDPPPAQRFLGDLPGAPEDTLARPTQEALQILADADIATAAGTAGRVWFVVYARAEAQYADSGRPELRDAQDWLRARYRPAGRLTFNDLYVYLYSAAGTAPRPC